MEHEFYLTFDRPIPYKDLLIYPVKMSDYILFHWCVCSLLLDKNGSGKAEYISMNYLQYLYDLSSSNSNMPYLTMLDNLLTLVLRLGNKSDIKFFGSENKKSEVYFLINGKKYDNNDLMNIKKIIFEQNCIEDIDETISKEVRDAMKDAEEYRLRQNANKMCSLEDQMICVTIGSSYKLNDIYDLTIRKFTKTLERIDHTLHYKIYLSAKMSGMVKFKDKDEIKHWMADLTQKDIYSSDKIDMDEMKNKIDGINK